MNSWDKRRRGGLRDLGECWFLCLSCPPGTRYALGGQRGFRKHLLIIHGRDEWPVTETVDSDGFVLGDDGNPVLLDGEPVLPSEEVAGLITTRPTKHRLWSNR